MGRSFGVAGLLAFLLPGTAAAQAWLKDRAATEGPGVKTGNFEVHPGIGSEVGYDSNWFLRADSTSLNVLNGAGNAQPIVGIPILRITPSISLSTLANDRLGTAAGDPPKFKFRASASATYREFLASEWSDQRNVGGAVNLDTQIAPQQPLNGTVGLGYIRTVNPTASGNPDLMFTRNDVLANGDVGYSPGGGTLEFRAGYRGRFSSFENNPSLRQNEHTAVGRARWLFRPRNALFIDVAYGALSYETNTSDTRDLAPMRLKLGTSGLLTPRIGVLLVGGYGSSGVQAGAGTDPADFASFIGQGEVRYFFDAAALPDAGSSDPGSTNALAVGVLRDFAPSMLGSVNSLTRGYLRGTYLWQGKVFTSIEGGVSSIGFNALTFTSGTSAGTRRADAFKNVRPDFTAFAEYRLSSSLGFNATLKYMSNSSNVGLKQDASSATYVDLNWTRVEAYAGLRYAL